MNMLYVDYVIMKSIEAYDNVELKVNFVKENFS